MKIALIGIALLISALFFTGCASNVVGGSGKGSVIQRTLDMALPPDFRGDAVVKHRNAWIDLTIDIKGLYRTEQGWSWSSLEYGRGGRFSHGSVTATPRKE